MQLLSLNILKRFKKVFKEVLTLVKSEKFSTNIEHLKLLINTKGINETTIS